MVIRVLRQRSPVRYRGGELPLLAIGGASSRVVLPEGLAILTDGGIAGRPSRAAPLLEYRMTAKTPFTSYTTSVKLEVVARVRWQDPASDIRYGLSPEEDPSKPAPKIFTLFMGQQLSPALRLFGVPPGAIEGPRPSETRKQGGRISLFQQEEPLECGASWYGGLVQDHGVDSVGARALSRRECR